MQVRRQRNDDAARRFGHRRTAKGLARQVPFEGGSAIDPMVNGQQAQQHRRQRNSRVYAVWSGPINELENRAEHEACALVERCPVAFWAILSAFTNGTASSPRFVSSTAFQGDVPSPPLLAHFLERALLSIPRIHQARLRLSKSADDQRRIPRGSDGRTS